jgi:hypothetical protein
MECRVHGCTAKATRKVSVHGHPELKAEVCADHAELHERDGWLGGLVIPDDDEAYRKHTTLIPSTEESGGV